METFFLNLHNFGIVILIFKTIYIILYLFISLNVIPITYYAIVVVCTFQARLRFLHIYL